MWTAAEDMYLRERIGIVSVRSIAQRLGRTIDAVKVRAHRLELSRRVREGYNLADLSQVMGVAPSTARSWMRRGLLGEVHQVGGLRVSERAVSRFIRAHPHEYDLRRVDQVWFKSVIFGG
jgi:hypothetical protein